ncbi:cytochrome P450 [Trichoderma afarasin]
MTMEEGHQVALASIASGVTSRLYVFLAVAVLGCPLFLKVMLKNAYPYTFFCQVVQRLLKLLQLHKDYGPLVRIGPNEVSISDWRYYRAIYSSNKASSKLPTFYLPIVFVDQHNIFAMTSKEEHAARRKISASPYSLQSMTRLEPMIRSKADNLAKRLLEISSSATTGTVNAFLMCGLFSLEVVCKAGFGKDFPFEDTTDLTELLQAMDGSAFTFILDGLLPWLRPTGFAHKMPFVSEPYQHRRQWEQKSRALLREFLQLPDKDDGYLVSPYLSSVDGFLGRKLNHEEFVEEAMGIMFAGSGTTSTTLTYLLYALSRPGYEAIQTRLRAELKDCGESVSELRKLPYLNAVIKETFRLYPTIISSLPRVLNEPMKVHDIDLPVGTVVNMQNFVHHRDPAVFPDPELFNPERWLNPHADMESALTPFSLGRRACIGLNLAWDELYLAVSSVFRNLELRLGEEMTEADMELEDRFNIAPVGHKLMLKVSKAKELS